MFSLIIPVYNEEKNILPLLNDIFLSLKNYNNFEIIIINDSSTDKTKKNLEESIYSNKIIILNNNKNKGQSYSIHNGVKNAKFKTIVTIDGDGQNNPFDIPKLLELFNQNNEYFLVGGIRKKRKDNLIKILSSKLANYVRSKILRDNCKDTGCSLKVFDRNTFLEFPYFDGIHRFIPALYAGYGYQTKFIEVSHRERVHGFSKYGTFDRMIKGIRDIKKVKKILKERKINE
tara:strand:+ start:82 stop:774 length:693 start_codon:yes stop_codon:yes gene_type:complete